MQRRGEGTMQFQPFESDCHRRSASDAASELAVCAFTRSLRDQGFAVVRLHLPTAAAAAQGCGGASRANTRAAPLSAAQATTPTGESETPAAAARQVVGKQRTGQQRTAPAIPCDFSGGCGGFMVPFIPREVEVGEDLIECYICKVEAGLADEEADARGGRKCKFWHCNKCKSQNEYVSWPVCDLCFDSIVRCHDPTPSSFRGVQSAVRSSVGNILSLEPATKATHSSDVPETGYVLIWVESPPSAMHARTGAHKCTRLLNLRGSPPRYVCMATKKHCTGERAAADCATLGGRAPRLCYGAD